MKTTTTQQLIKTLKLTQADPLTPLFIDEWQIGNRIVRLNGGMVQWRKMDEPYFTLGVPMQEFIQQAEMLLNAES